MSLPTERRYSESLQAVNQRVPVGLPHTGQVVTIEVDETTLTIRDEQVFPAPA